MIDKPPPGTNRPARGLTLSGGFPGIGPFPPLPINAPCAGEPLDLLMSIIPVVGRRIMSGKKKYEYRRSIFRRPVNRIYLYLSSPERKITGYFDYNGYLEGAVGEIWEATKGESAATEDAYLDYFKNTRRAFAIRIEEFVKFAEPLDPWKTPGFLPPQSFRYVKAGSYGTIFDPQNSSG